MSLALALPLRGLLGTPTPKFSGDDVFVTYPLQASAPKDLFALWRGDLAPQSDGFLTIELRAEDARELTRRLPSRAPTPRRITFGPVINNDPDCPEISSPRIS